MILGYKIKKIREIKRLTQKEVAEAMGISQGAYSRLELGETEISIRKLEIIAKIFGLETTDIISFNESMVFNLSNNQYASGITLNSDVLSQRESKSYTDQIEFLKSEIEFLKKLIEQIMMK